MDDKDVRKLKREELLELLIIQKRENENLRNQLDEVRAKLEDKRLQIEKFGSIAEASYMLNGLFDAAQETVLQYLQNTCREKSGVSGAAMAVCPQVNLEELREKVINLEFKRKNFGGYDCSDVEDTLKEIVSTYEACIEKERNAYNAKLAEQRENIEILRMLTIELNQRVYHLRKDRKNKKEK